MYVSYYYYYYYYYYYHYYLQISRTKQRKFCVFARTIHKFFRTLTSKKLYFFHLTYASTWFHNRALKSNLVMKLMMIFGLDYINAAVKINLAALPCSWPKLALGQPNNWRKKDTLNFHRICTKWYISAMRSANMVGRLSKV